MTIKELEQILNITRANIRFYEQEDLIHPSRLPNGYRNYSQQDAAQLKKNKLMRELGVSISDIKKLQLGELELHEEIEHVMQKLAAQQADSAKAGQICYAIQQDQVSYDELDADRYLRLLSKSPAPDSTQTDICPAPPQALSSIPDSQNPPPTLSSMPDSHDPMQTLSSMPDSHESVQTLSSMPDSHDPMQTLSSIPDSHDPMQALSSMPDSHDPMQALSSMPDSHNPMQTLSPTPDSHDHLQALSSLSDHDRLQNDLDQDRPPIIPPAFRYLARTLDMVLFIEIVICAASLFHINYLAFLPFYGTHIILQLVWLFVEPLCIHLTGTTIGKCIFGLYLEDLNGKRPSYASAFSRTIRVFFYGMGLRIPLVSLYRYYKSYDKAADGHKLPWEDEIEYIQKTPVIKQKLFPALRSGTWRCILFAAVCLFSLFITYGCTLYALVPVHRGNLTLEEFAENYNQTARYLGYTDSYHQMKPDGTFYTSEELKKLEKNTAHIIVFSTDDDNRGLFPFDYSFDGDCLKEVTLRIDYENAPTETVLTYPYTQMAIAALAFAGAQDGISLWTNERGRMLDHFVHSEFSQPNGFSYNIGDMEISCYVKLSGFGTYFDSYMIALEPNNHFHLEYTLRRSPQHS